MKDFDLTGRRGKGSGQQTLPNLSEVLHLIGDCRGYALAVGALAVACATAESTAERTALAAELTEYRRRYSDSLAEKMRKGPYLGDIAEIAAHRVVVHAFADHIRHLRDDGTEITRDDALELASRARNGVLPAIDAIVDHLALIEQEATRARLERMSEKAAMVDGMLTEMGRLGRMIGLISVNASVEAARAGGEAGRAFQVVAEEVRNLARQSSDVVARMKHRLAEDTIDS